MDSTTSANLTYPSTITDSGTGGWGGTRINIDAYPEKHEIKFNENGYIVARCPECKKLIYFKLATDGTLVGVPAAEVVADEV